ncbi:hypothetical protein JCM3770_004565, partial [Rhodotorula araucariae]
AAGAAGAAPARQEPAPLAAPIDAPAPARREDDEVEMDFDEDDIYGDSAPSAAAPTAAGGVPSSAALADLAASLSTRPGRRGRIVLSVKDTVAGYGAVRGLVMGLVDDESPAELVAATGAGKSAGLTIFHRTLYPRSRRPVHLPASGDAVDSRSSSSPPFVPTGGLWRVQLATPRAGAPREVWVASDAERSVFYTPALVPVPAPAPDGPAPRMQMQAVRLGDPANEPPVLAAGTLGGGAALVTVSRDALRVYDAGLVLQQTVPHPHGALDPRAHAPHASFAGEHVVVHAPVGGGAGGARARTTPRVYRWSAAEGVLAKVPSPSPATEERGGARAAVFLDWRRCAPLVRPAVVVAPAARGRDADADMEDDLYGRDDADDAPQQGAEGDGAEEAARVLEGEPCEWVAEVGAGGHLRASPIRLVPSGDEIFASSAVSLFPDVLEDGETDRVLPDGIDEDDVKVDRVSVAYLGPVGRETLHLFILLTNGQLAVYEAFASLSAVAPVTPTAPRAPRLAARFVKTLVRHVPAAPVRRKGAGVGTGADLALPPPKRGFVPFAALAGAGAAVLLTGDEAVWLVKGSHGPARAVEHAERGVYAAVELAGAPAGAEEAGEMVLQTRDGCFVARLPAALTLDSPIPYTHVPKDRVYAHLAFDLESGLYAGATLNETRFVAFDEEGQPLWKEQDPNLIEPTNYRSTLELLVPGSWQAIHGHEFRQNEFVTSLKSVSLASRSTPTGQRDFVAVGTAVYRAEDLATKGGIYVFEIIPVNPHPSMPHLSHQFRLLFFEDAKAAVNNVCDLNGYLFLSMGQKLYARAFEQDEFLLAVGFLDVGVHVKSLTALKNFLLIGDEQQSISLVAFQEDPYKLVLLGRDYRPSRVGGANFIVNEGKVAFVSNDDAGVLRLFEYDPTNIASYAGQRLLCRTEFNTGSESHASLLFARHAPGEDAKQNGILYGALDGSLATLVPVRDAVFRRLQSLQAMMTRHVLHFGGLNPRGYRIVKNDSVSRAIVKGILDGDLLARFEALSLDYQNELAGAVGTDADTVRANLRNLRGFE